MRKKFQAIADVFRGDPSVKGVPEGMKSTDPVNGVIEFHNGDFPTGGIAEDPQYKQGSAGIIEQDVSTYIVPVVNEVPFFHGETGGFGDSTLKEDPALSLPGGPDTYLGVGATGDSSVRGVSGVELDYTGTGGLLRAVRDLRERRFGPDREYDD